ncbi:hypothetical protein [Nonomuraea dietziae]|uniref:hypothetical protein n=1 Tax=Nonomuraea dietziae TaxID=65515 RepID=UPI0031E09511
MSVAGWPSAGSPPWGNAADVTPAELLGWLSRDPSTSAVGLYLEDPRDGLALFSALSSCPPARGAAGGGRSGQGRRAAASHTGGMVSDARIWQALADQTGATLVTTQDALIGALAYFQAHTPRPLADPGPRPAGPRSGRAPDGRGVGGRPQRGRRACSPPTPSTSAGLTLDPLPDDALDDLRALGLGAGSSLANWRSPWAPEPDPTSSKR